MVVLKLDYLCTMIENILLQLSITPTSICDHVKEETSYFKDMLMALENAGIFAMHVCNASPLSGGESRIPIHHKGLIIARHHRHVHWKIRWTERRIHVTCMLKVKNVKLMCVEIIREIKF